MIPPKKLDTVNTIDKSRCTPGSILSNNLFHIEETSKININRDNEDVFYLYSQGESLASVTPNQQRIPRSFFSVIRK